MDMRCVFKVSADFGKGYGVTATSGGQFGVITENGRITLPGDELEQSFKAAGSPLRARKAMDDYLSPAPSGSCETSLEVAVDGVVQFAPDLMVTVNTDGDTKMTISGSVRSSSLVPQCFVMRHKFSRSPCWQEIQQSNSGGFLPGIGPSWTP